MSANGLPLIRTPWERVRIFIGASFFVCQIFGYILIAVSASPWGKAVAIVAFFATRPFYSLKRPQSRTYVRPKFMAAL